MARIRNVKPEFFQHEDLQRLETENPGNYLMLVYAGLWTQAAKNGVFEWKPKILHLYILPFLEFDIEKTLRILADNGYLKRFEKDGKRYGYIPTFSQHQTISGQEHKQRAKFPDYLEGSDWEITNNCQSSEEEGKNELKTKANVPSNTERNNKEAIRKEQGSDKEVIGIVQGSEREVTEKADIGHRTLDIGHRTLDIMCAHSTQALSDNHENKEAAKPQQKRFIKPMLEEIQNYCKERQNSVDPLKFYNYYESNGWKVGRNPMKDWRAAIRTWERNETQPKDLKVFSRPMLEMPEV
jgi:hypothetical protein